MIPDQYLAPYAAQSATARGRRFAETSHASRSQFQRDRDRIIHCSAFRRLEYKTQVFLNHEGDMFRTRLTHSLEVAQVGRSMARNLRLNEDLVEALALAHDLGHTPFGHVGQDVLNECMQDHGGFEHNLQSLRVVDELEQHYGAFDGLNLMFDTREGILKHCSLAHAKELGPVAQRFIDRTQPTLEAQLTNLADEIAYNSHDIDDGLRSGLITISQLEEVDFFARRWHEVQAAHPGLAGRRAIYETLRRLITVRADHLIATSSALLPAPVKKLLLEIAAPSLFA
jgi:dGTPase